MASEYRLAKYADGIPVVTSTSQRDQRFPSPDTNQRVHNIETGTIERYDGTVWVTELVGTPGADGAPGEDGIGVYASASARDAAFPTPATGDKVYRSDYGALERYTGSAFDALTESKRSVNPVADGADPTGAADSRAAFVAAEARGRDLALTKGTYKLASNVTLSGHYRVEKGAMLQPASGVTVTITGPIDAGHYQILDLSAGGSVSFAGNTSIPAYSLSWVGAGLGGLDDGDLINALYRAVPDYCTIVGPPSHVYPTTKTIQCLNRGSVRLVGEGGDPNLDQTTNGTIPAIKWVNTRVLPSVASIVRCHESGDEVTVGSTAAGATSLTIGASTLTGSLWQYQQFRIAGTTYTLTGSATASGNQITVSFTPATAGIIAAGTPVRLYPNANVTTATAHGLTDLESVGVESTDASDAPYCGTRQVRVIDSTHFTYTVDHAALNAVPSGPIGTTSLIWTLFSMWESAYCSVERFQLHCGSTPTTCALVDIDIDGYGSNSGPGDSAQFGTACTVEYNNFRNWAAHPSWIGLRISASCTNNQEFHKIRHNTFYGVSTYTEYIPAMAYDSIAAGTGAVVATTRTPFTAGMTTSGPLGVGMRVRLADAGPLDSDGLRTQVDGRITAVTDSGHATIDTLATVTTTGGRMMLGESIGTGIRIGNSANAKAIEITDNNFDFLATGIEMFGGSVMLAYNKYSGNEIDVHAVAQTEGCYEVGADCEISRQHLVAAQESWVCLAPRVSFQNTKINGGQYAGAAGFVLIAGTYGPTVPTKGYLFDCSTVTPILIGGNASQLTSPLEINRNAKVLVNAIGAPGFSTQLVAEHYFSKHLLGVATEGAATAIFRHVGNSFLASDGIGLKGECNVGTGFGGTEEPQAVVGECATDGLMANGAQWRSFTARLPRGATTPSARTGMTAAGYYVSPTTITGNTFDAAYGLYVPEMQVTNVTKGWGVYLPGATNDNLVRGRTYQGAPASAPTDANLPTNTISFYLDEAGGNLKVRIRKSDGTYKTSTIAMV